MMILFDSQSISLDSFPTSVSDLDSFKIRFARCIALALSIDSMLVVVTLLEQRAISSSRSSFVSLLSVSVGLEYSITSTDGSNICNLMITLNQVISDGTLSSKLDSVGLSNIILGTATTTDICPTILVEPSSADSSTKRLGTIRIAIIVAVIIAVVILICVIIAYLWCKRSHSRSKVYVHNKTIVIEDTEHDFNVLLSPAFTMVPYKVPLIGPDLRV